MSFLAKDIRNFYRGKHAVVVGGAGFVGHRLVRLLLLAGASVKVLDDFSRGSVKSEGATYDVLDVGTMGPEYHTVVDRFSRADVVFNLAATVAGVLHNEKNHQSMYQSNMRVLSAPVLAAEEVGVPVFMQTSSVCVYAPEWNSPSQEDYGMRGTPHEANAGYAEAKRDGERMVQWASGIGRSVIVRPSNIAGGGDYYDDRAHVIPAFVERAFNNDGVFVLYGYPLSTREFIHPLDVAGGMMYAAAFGEDKEAYNIGTNGETTVTIKDLAEKIMNQAQINTDYSIGRPKLEYDTSVGGGDPDRWSDSSKINALGWEAEIGLSKIVEQCVEDYLENHHNK